MFWCLGKSGRRLGTLGTLGKGGRWLRDVVVSGGPSGKGGGVGTLMSQGREGAERGVLVSEEGLGEESGDMGEIGELILGPEGHGDTGDKVGGGELGEHQSRELGELG